MAEEKAKEVEVEEKDDDLLEASKTEDQQLQEFKADGTGGEGALASVVKGAEVPEPASTVLSSSLPSADPLDASTIRASMSAYVTCELASLSPRNLIFPKMSSSAGLPLSLNKSSLGPALASASVLVKVN